MESNIFLSAEWRHLVMLNYDVDPAVLQPLVPAGTELDLWQGRSLMSIVGFLFLNTRVRGIPIPFHRNFEELNLRFYVRRQEAREVRRGVVFVKEIVPRFAIAMVARIFYNENYISRAMRHEIEADRIMYEWRGQSGWDRLEVRPAGKYESLRGGSEEEFITEHYWGYARQRDGGTVEYRVDHPAWRVRQAGESYFDCDAASLYGAGFADALRGKPASAFIAEGSPVVVRPGRKIESA